jgi:hypothetical protein
MDVTHTRLLDFGFGKTEESCEQFGEGYHVDVV